MLKFLMIIALLPFAILIGIGVLVAFFQGLFE